MVVLVEDAKEMMSICVVFEFYAKVINDQGKGNQACAVHPESQCIAHWGVSMQCQPSLEEFVCQDACLGQPIHSLLNFKIHIAMVIDCSEIVLVDYFRRDEGNGDLHVFIPIKWCVEVKVLYVCHDVFCARHR